MFPAPSAVSTADCRAPATAALTGNTGNVPRNVCATFDISAFLARLNYATFRVKEKISVVLQHPALCLVSARVGSQMREALLFTAKSGLSCAVLHRVLACERGICGFLGVQYPDNGLL